MARDNHEYILGADESERERLLLHCEIHRPEAERLLESVGVQAGMRAIDLGCGPLGILDLLSQRLGAGGEVTGLDNEPRMLTYAEQTIAERDIRNVRLIRADAGATRLPAGSFDLAHERLVLINHPSPQEIVAEMVRVTRPGGWIAVQEIDLQWWTCEPSHPAWSELLDALIRSSRVAGLDPFIGRRLPVLLREAGVRDLGLEAHAYVWGSSDPYQTALLTFVGLFRDRILALGELTEPGLDRLTQELGEHLAGRDTYVVHPLLFQAWGRKPADSEMSASERTV